ncbi:SGNH/GDSL hydrolase family protein [bacterium]|nr:SGNH/GDSL hydrolase family protein [bacterium]
MLRGILALSGIVLVASAPCAAREFTRLAVLGDSVNYGVNPDYDPVVHGWTHMLLGVGGDPFPPTREATLHSLWPGMAALNASVSGSTAVQWAAGNSPYMNSVLAFQPDLAIVLLGGWDVINFMADGTITTAEKNQLFSSLSTIVARLETLDPPPYIILLTYYDLMDGYSQSLPLIYGRYRPLSPMTLEGNAFIRQLASERGCGVVDVYPAFLHHCYGRQFGDPTPLEPPYVRLPVSNLDIHPNTAGHEQIYLLVYDALAGLRREPERFTVETADLDKSGAVDGTDLVLLLSSVRERRTRPRSLLSFAQVWGMGTP